MIFGQVGKHIRRCLAQSFCAIRIRSKSSTQIKASKSLRVLLQVFPSSGLVTSHGVFFRMRDRLQASSYGIQPAIACRQAPTGFNLPSLAGKLLQRFVGASLLAISGFLHQDFEFDGI
jgi:hypothetical protein